MFPKFPAVSSLYQAKDPKGQTCWPLPPSRMPRSEEETQFDHCKYLGTSWCDRLREPVADGTAQPFHLARPDLTQEHPDGSKMKQNTFRVENPAENLVVNTPFPGYFSRHPTLPHRTG